MVTYSNNRYSYPSGAFSDSDYDSYSESDAYPSSGQADDYRSDYQSGYQAPTSRRSTERVTYNEREVRQQEEVRYANNPISIGNAHMPRSDYRPASRSGYSQSANSDSRNVNSDYSSTRSRRPSGNQEERRSYRRSPSDAQEDAASYSRDSYSRDSRSRDSYSRSSYTRDCNQENTSASEGSDRDAYGAQAYARDSYGRATRRTRSGGTSSRRRATENTYDEQSDASYSRASGASRSSRRAQRTSNGEKQTREKRSFGRRQKASKQFPTVQDYSDDVRSQDASRYSRDVSGESYAKRSKQKKSKKRKIIVGILIVLAVLIAVFGGTIWAYISNISSNLINGVSSELRAKLVDTQYKDDPFYMVLLGVDKSEAREGDADFEGDSFRSDSMMLARVDPKSHKVVLVSLLRDTLVNMGKDGNRKLNEAYAIGGAAKTVEVISNLAGVDISHYAEVDLNGFEAIVDSLGGIEVDVPMEINDDEAGGHLDAGLQTLDGWQALILCRTRHTYDDFGAGDMYRASNQRVVLSAIAQKLLSADILTIAKTASTLSEYVTTDLDVSDIIGYAQVMRGIDASADIYTASEPTGSIYIDGGWYEYIKKTEWMNMMTRINDGLPPTEASETDATGTVLSNAGNVGAEGNAGTASTKKIDWSRFNGYDYEQYAPLGSPDGGITGNPYGVSGLV